MARAVEPRTVARIFIGLFSAFLLVTQGAQIAAAPVTVPALWWAARSTGSRRARIVLTLVASSTVAIVGWFIVYLAVRERQPYGTLGPVLGFAVTAAVFWRTAHGGGPVERGE